MATAGAWIKVAACNQYFFSNTSSNDLIIYTGLPTQKILFGTSNTTTSALTLTSNTIITGANIIPYSNYTYSLGTSNLRFKDLFLGSNSLYLGNTKFSCDSSGTVSLTDYITGSNQAITVQQIQLGSACNSVILTYNSNNNQLLLNTYSNGSLTGQASAGGGGWSNTSSNVYIIGSNVGIGISNPSYPLDVNGDLNFTGILRQGGLPYVGSQWSNSSTNVFLIGSNVGIGISNPTEQFQSVKVLSSNVSIVASNIIERKYPPVPLYLSSNVTVSNQTIQTSTLSNLSYGNGTYTFISNSMVNSLDGSNYGAWHVFDSNVTTYYEGYNNQATAGVPLYSNSFIANITLPYPIRLSKYTIYGDSNIYFLSSWRVFGITNLGSNILLDTQNNIVNWLAGGETKTYTVTNSNPFYGYTFMIDKVITSATTIRIYDIGVYGYEGAGITMQDNTITGYPLVVNPNGGNIGFGISNPAYSVDINGDVGIRGNLNMINKKLTFSGLQILPNSSNIGNISAVINNIPGFSNELTNVMIYVNSNSSNDYIRFAASNSELVRIQGSGNVGIGTSNPVSKLDINGDINLSGTMRSNNIPCGLVVPGVILQYAGSSSPNGWLLCNGSAVSRTTYSVLFSVIGTTYGTGDGSTTFNVPDMRGRVAIGVGQGTGLTNRTIAQTGGEETHILSVAEMPTHNHGVTDPGHTHLTNASSFGGNAGGTGLYNPTNANSWTSTSTTSASSTTGISIQNNGSSSAHNNMQPFIAINFIIKT